MVGARVAQAEQNVTGWIVGDGWFDSRDGQTSLSGSRPVPNQRVAEFFPGSKVDRMWR